MGADRVQIDALRQRKRDLAERLHAVAMEERLGVLLFDGGGEGGDIVDGARLVVDVDDGDEGSMFIDQPQQIFRVCGAVRIQAGIAHLDAAALQLFCRLIYGGMLARCGDKIAAADGGEDRLVVRLAAGSREHELSNPAPYREDGL